MPAEGKQPGSTRAALQITDDLLVARCAFKLWRIVLESREESWHAVRLTNPRAKPARRAGAAAIWLDGTTDFKPGRG